MKTIVATDTLLPHLIASRAADSPDAVAVVADGHTWTYGQLVDCAAQVAATLRQRAAAGRARPRTGRPAQPRLDRRAAVTAHQAAGPGVRGVHVRVHRHPQRGRRR